MNWRPMEFGDYILNYVLEFKKRRRRRIKIFFPGNSVALPEVARRGEG